MSGEIRVESIAAQAEVNLENNRRIESIAAQVEASQSVNQRRMSMMWAQVEVLPGGTTTRRYKIQIMR